MFHRAPPLPATQEAPFGGDKLEREASVKNLTQLIRGSTGPAVIAIDAPWGQGKTTFIRMCSAWMESQGISTVLFNAWEADLA